MPRRTKRRPIQELSQLVREKIPRGSLHYSVLQLAADINKQTIRRQLGFLLERLGPAKAEQKIKEVLTIENEITKLTAQVVRGDRLGVLLRAVYDQKMKEAHAISHSRPRNVVRSLVQMLGVEKVRRLVNGT